MVSDDVIKTLNNMVWSGAANYAVHQRHMGNALTEFTGLEPDKIEFDIYLSMYLGVSPHTELNMLWGYERNGTPCRLTIGTKAYGKYKWSILSHKIKMQTWLPNGNLAACTVSVSLQEYLAS